MNTVPLGELATFISGGTPPRGKPENYAGEIPWITGADIAPTGEVKARSFITPQAIDGSAASLIPAGTIVLVTRTSVGKVGVVSTPTSFSQDITAIRHDPDRLHRAYLVHYLRSQEQNLISRARGATIKGVTRDVVSDLRVPLFPRHEQQRIATVLDQADALRAKRARTVALLTGMRQALFSAKLAKFGSWPVVRLGSLINDSRLGIVKSASEQASDLPYEYVKMDSITRDGELSVSSLARVAAGPDEVARCSVEDGDLLFNTRNTRELVGKSAVYRGSARLFNNNLLRLRFHDAALPDYVHGFLWSVDGRRQLEVRKSGTTSVFAIYAKGLATIEIPIPPLDLQYEYAQAVRRVREQVERALAQGRALDAIARSLQEQAFSGRL